ncbi:MAG: hypothetical protein WBA10_02145 [Elainellaceae cyanobacterium]
MLSAETALSDRCSLSYTTLPDGQLSDGNALPLLGEPWNGPTASPSNQTLSDTAKAAEAKRSRRTYRGRAVSPNRAIDESFESVDKGGLGDRPLPYCFTAGTAFRPS